MVDIRNLYKERLITIASAIGGRGHTGVYAAYVSYQAGEKAAAADDSSHGKFICTEGLCSHGTDTVVLGVGECSVETSDVEGADLATYPVVCKQAGELAEKLSRHHQQNTNGTSNASIGTIQLKNVKKSAPLLLVVIHGALLADAAFEDAALTSLTNFHGQIKSPGERTVCVREQLPGTCPRVPCHPNAVGRGLAESEDLVTSNSTLTSPNCSKQGKVFVTPGDDHLILDGIRACDHTYALDSVDVYTVVSKHSDCDECKHDVPNAGIGEGILACQTADEAKKAIGSLPIEVATVCCVGDLLYSTGLLKCTNEETGRYVKHDAEDTAKLVRDVRQVNFEYYTDADIRKQVDRDR